MDTVLTKPEKSYKFDRRLTDEEIEELVESYEYDPYYDQNEKREPEPMYDIYGNPTRDTIAAMYEIRHGITHDRMTLDEFHNWMTEMYEESE